MENNKTVNFDDFRKEAKKREREEKFDRYVKQPVKTVIYWAACNPIAAIGTFSAVAVPLATKAMRVHQEHIEDRRRLVDWYDTRRGKHVMIRRPLTRKEQIEVDRRYENKESYTSIFADMELLK